MPRVTDAERKLFHEILDEAIDKMNLPKNAAKTHWHCMKNTELVELLLTETFELRHAIYFLHDDAIQNECKDVLNFASMISDNARSGRI